MDTDLGSQNVVNPTDPDLKQALLIIKDSFVYNIKLKIYKN